MIFLTCWELSLPQDFEELTLNIGLWNTANHRVWMWSFNQLDDQQSTKGWGCKVSRGHSVAELIS